MASEQLLVLAELQDAGVSLRSDLIDLAQSVNTQGGAMLPDSATMENLYNWRGYEASEGVDWRKLLQGYTPAKRGKILLAVGSAIKAFTQYHDPLLHDGTLGEIRNLSVPELLTLPYVGSIKGGILRIAFARSAASKPAESEDYLLDELVNQAVLRFELQDNLVNQFGRVEGFSLVDAADHVLRQVENIDEVFDSLTRIRPDSAGKVLGLASDSETWADFKLRSSIWIVDFELEQRYPELEAEGRRRKDYWDNLA